MGMFPFLLCLLIFCSSFLRFEAVVFVNLAKGVFGLKVAPLVLVW